MKVRGLFSLLSLRSTVMAVDFRHVYILNFFELPINNSWADSRSKTQLECLLQRMQWEKNLRLHRGLVQYCSFARYDNCWKFMTSNRLPLQRMLRVLVVAGRDIWRSLPFNRHWKPSSILLDFAQSLKKMRHSSKFKTEEWHIILNMLEAGQDIQAIAVPVGKSHSTAYNVRIIR